MIDIFSYETSKISWCETNYMISNNICEFFNSITNLYYIYNSVRLYSDLKKLHGNRFSIFNYKNLSNLERNNINITIIGSLIGIFSIYFHGTLSYMGQLLDEYSIYILLLTLDDVKTYVFFRLIVGLILMNIKTEYNRFMLFVYGLYRSISLFNYYFRETESVVKKCFNYGIFFFFSGMSFWIIDFAYCDKLIFSTHWIWHISSSYALYYISNFLILIQIRPTLKNLGLNLQYQDYLTYLSQSFPLYRESYSSYFY